MLFEKNVDGVNYFFTKKFGIYFVATTKTNVAPSTILDIIYRMMKIFRDYCGVLNEESIRKNFVLIYEIIDEVIDYGHAQLVTTENIRQFIVNEPVLLQPKAAAKKTGWRPKIFKSSTVASTAIQKPIQKLDAKKTKTNEIFVDIFEKLTVSKMIKFESILRSLTWIFLLCADIVQRKWHGNKCCHRRSHSNEELFDW